MPPAPSGRPVRARVVPSKLLDVEAPAGSPSPRGKGGSRKAAAASADAEPAQLERLLGRARIASAPLGRARAKAGGAKAAAASVSLRGPRGADMAAEAHGTQDNGTDAGKNAEGTDSEQPRRTANGKQPAVVNQPANEVARRLATLTTVDRAPFVQALSDAEFVTLEAVDYLWAHGELDEHVDEDGGLQGVAALARRVRATAARQYGEHPRFGKHTESNERNTQDKLRRLLSSVHKTLVLLDPSTRALKLASFRRANNFDSEQ
eukprot:1409764-Prymnesium_polylepis.1